MTTLLSIEPSTLEIPFKGVFKHASAERRAMQSLWVRVRDSDGLVGYGEGCPREYVTAESLSTAMAFVDRHRAEWMEGLGDLQSLRQWVSAHEAEIDIHPAAWTAVELALLDLFGKAQQSSIEQLLGLAEIAGRFRIHGRHRRRAGSAILRAAPAVHSGWIQDIQDQARAGHAGQSFQSTCALGSRHCPRARCGLTPTISGATPGSARLTWSHWVIPSRLSKNRCKQGTLRALPLLPARSTLESFSTRA